MKKYLLLLLLLPLTFYGQVKITKPVDKQLVARIPTDNDRGVVSFQGRVDKGGVERDYDQIQIWVFRSGAPYPNSSSYKHKKNLSYIGDIANFTYNNIKIRSQKKQYSFEVYGRERGTLYYIKTINDVVAGDVYIIQGQSNAVAKGQEDGGSSSSQENRFIRVYGSGTQKFNSLLNQDNWYEGVGDASTGQPGNTGQWGIKLARLLLDEFGYPIAIFNGARGASDISYYLEDYQEWESGDSGPEFLPNHEMNNNFGRLYYRLERTGLAGNVRAVLWSHGERAGSSYPTNIYKNYFLDLKADWKSNYPSVEMFYIFQTRYCQGCDIRPFSNHDKPAYFGKILEIKEAQRQLADEKNDIQIMPTNTLNLSYFVGDGWHFKYPGGYEYFATRIFELVSRDIYGISKSNDINAPNITKATLSGTKLILETDANSLSMDADMDVGDFILGSAGQSTITNVNVSGSDVILTLSASPGNSTTISYTAQRVDDRPPSYPPAKFIKNSKGIELLCFNEYPIIDLGGEYISSVYIPDNNFEQALIDLGYDDILDDHVLTSNISNISNLDVSKKNIKELTGIEGFENLQSLNCQNNRITNLDLSQNTQLEYLRCHYNEIRSLNINESHELRYLNCRDNQIQSIDLTKNLNLEVLNCLNNELQALDLTQNALLATLYCNNNRLEHLDLNKNDKLEIVNCRKNALVSLDMNNWANSLITDFNTTGNPNLTCITVDNATDANAGLSPYNNWSIDGTTSYCENDAMTFVPDNNFEQALIDLGYDTIVDGYVRTINIYTILELDLIDKNISDLTGIEGFKNLSTLFLRNNQLTSLDISKNIHLKDLRCFNNQLQNIDVSKNLELEYLNCRNNQIQSIDLSKNSKLEVLNCLNNDLQDLDLTQNTLLNELYCNSNELEHLDLSKNDKLVLVNCRKNALVSLDMKNGANSLITDFNTSGNPNLTCIKVDNATDANTGLFPYDKWETDEIATYSENCSYYKQGPLVLAKEDPILSPSITLYPNPATNILNIDSGLIKLSKIEIYTILGQKVKEVPSNINTINLSELANGVYMVRLYFKDGITLKRLIKK